MVKLRLFASGGPKDCVIDEESGSVVESTSNAPNEGSKAKPKVKRKVHPPSLIKGPLDEYIQNLVAQKLREGWQVVSDDDDKAADRLHLLLVLPPGLAVRHFRNVLQAMGIASPVSEEDGLLNTTRFNVEQVEVAAERSGTSMRLTAICGKKAIPALAILFLCLSELSRGAYGDGTDANLKEIVFRAREAGLIRQELLDAAYAFDVLPRPLNLAALARPNGRRSTFRVAL